MDNSIEIADHNTLAIIIAALSALTAIATGAFTWWKFHFERRAWLIDIKKSYTSEVLKSRLETYDLLNSLLLQLSSARRELEPNNNRAVSIQLNEWLYGKGGLVAGRHLRNCVVHLRNLLNGDDFDFSEIAQWKHRTVFYMRYDIDVVGLEDANSISAGSTLHETRAHVEALLSDHPVAPKTLGRYGDPRWSPVQEISGKSGD